MKALSLWQPHATAIGIGLKSWETRGWPTSYRGPLAIHAAKRSWDDVGPWHTQARRVFEAYVTKRGPIPWYFGAVVCTVDLVDCVPASRLRGRLSPDVEFWGDFSDGEDGTGRFAFKLENPQLIWDRIEVRGMQGFFDVDLGALERAPSPPAQLGLFELGIPGMSDPQEIPAAGDERDRDAASTPSTDVGAGLFDLPLVRADVAQEPQQELVARDEDERADGESDSRRRGSERTSGRGAGS